MARRGLLEGKVVLVTGGASGIGAATAALAAHEGAAAVVVTDVKDPVASGVAALDPAGVAPDFQRLDVGDSAAVDALVEGIVQRYGRLDCAVNNAGVPGLRKRMCDYTDAQWHDVTRVNLDGVFYCMRAQIRAMLAGGGGAIVNVASGAHVRPNPGLAAYSATKSGVVAMTKAAAGEHARDGIRINAVLPGPTRTPMFVAQLGNTEDKLAALAAGAPLGRLGLPAEQAEAIVWMCSDRSSYVDGTILLVDGAAHSYSGPAVPVYPPSPD